MPLYRCVVPAGGMPTDRRAAVAEAITRIHCEVTGAPATFVHVFYFDAPDGAPSPRFQVHGSIRSGRTDEQHETIRSRIREAFTRLAGVAEDDVTATTVEMPARWVMEGGVLLPEPGEEDAWLARHHAS